MWFDFASKCCDPKSVCFVCAHVFAQLCVDRISHVGRETREEGEAAQRVVLEDRERVGKKEGIGSTSRQLMGMVGMYISMWRLQHSRSVCKMRCMQPWSLWCFDWTSSRNI